MLTQQWFWLRWGILGLCWGLFCLVWLIGAIYNALKAPAVRKRSGLFSTWIVGIVLFVVVAWFIPHSFWRLLIFDTPWLRVIGIICLLLSTAFTLWARQMLGTMWSFSAVARTDHELHTDGPYRITRHPIYTGVLGMLFGTMLIGGLGPYAFIFLVGIVIFEIKLHQEERLLTETFGEQYVRYKQHVPQLIPGLKWGL
ncbi:MAG TPA: isoprenylcysteine carboxylmethyltransferase family protein [Ktedonobacteraceae bacterium]|nr:isoprenylcysteine carboxylmethyltransferase family protein [Ktedonobacteraceae bacterium]